MTSPTQRSLAKLREEGWKPAVVEHWNAFTRRRQDLFGFADLIALRGAEILLVQTTSGSNASARVRKIEAAEWLPFVRAAGIQIHVHGWKRYARRVDGKYWRCRVVDVS